MQEAVQIYADQLGAMLTKVGEIEAVMETLKSDLAG